MKPKEVRDKLKKDSEKFKEVRTSRQDEVKIDHKQQLADSELPLLLARDSTREQNKDKIGQLQQLAEGALPLLLARKSTRKQDEGKMGQQQ